MRVLRAGPLLLAGAIAALLAGCAPRIQPSGPPAGQARLTADGILTPDGTFLPVQRWLPAGRAKAVVIGLHGMNDYARNFALPGAAWRRFGIATYAYDQRGFGGTPQRGIWPGLAALRRDLRTAVTVLRARHPGVPVYAVGVSMGGGVILSAMARPDAPRLDGIILAAPAVWGRAYYPPRWRAALWLSAHTIPGYRVTARRLGKFRRLPSDNIALLRALWRDPMMIKGARIDATWGVINLMDSAHAAPPRIRVPVLMLYGQWDQIIPPGPIRDAALRLNPALRTVALYPAGYHMLLRDKARAVVHTDVAAWVLSRPSGGGARQSGRLPSGADRADALDWLARPHPCWTVRGGVSAPKRCARKK